MVSLFAISLARSPIGPGTHGYRRHRLRRFGACAAALVVTVATLSACSSDSTSGSDSSGASAASSAATTSGSGTGGAANGSGAPSSAGSVAPADCAAAPGVTADEVKVAVVVPLTGSAAPTFKGFLEAAQAAFDAQNDAGGVNGRKVTVVSDDDAGDGAQQVTAARNAVQSQGVFGIVAASRVDTMYDYLKGENVPVTGYAGQPAYANDRNVFGSSGASTTGYVATAIISRLKEAGATKIAVLTHNSPGGVNAANGFVVAAKQAGLEVPITQLDIPLGTFDATAVALKIKDSGADSLYTALLTDSSASVLKALQAQGVTLKTQSLSGAYDPAVSAQLGDLIKGAVTFPVGANVPTEVGNDATQKYVDTLAKYAPGVQPNEGFALIGYLSGLLFIKGLEVAGSCPSRAGFVDQLRAVTGYDAGGLLASKISFGPAELPNGTPYNKCSWFLVFDGKKWVPDAAETCGDLVKFSG